MLSGEGGAPIGRLIRRIRHAPGCRPLTGGTSGRVRLRAAAKGAAPHPAPAIRKTGRVLLGAAALFLAFAPAPAPVHAPAYAPAYANVFGTDDRHPLSPGDGFSAVGQIACAGSRRLPVATLIDHPALPDARAYDLVITVAHAFVGGPGNIETRCGFRPAGEARHEAPILRVALGTLEPAQAWHHDWAVAVVGARLSASFGALPVRTVGEQDLPDLARAGARYALIGKNGERPRMLISRNCGPVPKRHWHHGYFNTAEFNHDCDMIPGWSGGPLVLLPGEGRSRPAVIAVNATEVNGIAHHHGQPFHPRMFPNTAIRLDGAFLAAIARLAKAPAPGPMADLPGAPPAAPPDARLVVVPQGCPGGTHTTAEEMAAAPREVSALTRDLMLLSARNEGPARDAAAMTC